MQQADSAQTHLFTPKQYAELLGQNRNAGQRPVPDRVRLKNCRGESRVALGLREVTDEMYRLLGHEMSADVIRRELNALQVSILVESPGQGQYGMPSRANSDARRIYRSVGLSWNELPFAVSATGRKRKPATSR